jgi:hypothetical protein
MPGVKVTTQPLRKCLAAGLTRDDIERGGGKIHGANVVIDSDAPGFARVVDLFKVEFKEIVRKAPVAIVTDDLPPDEQKILAEIDKRRREKSEGLGDTVEPRC